MARDTTLILDNAKLLVVRKISSSRNVSNQELATCGIAIGNNLDNTESHIFSWVTERDGTKIRKYRIMHGKWPIYLGRNMSEVSEKFLKEGLDGSVVYIAEIDLLKHKLGTNVPFEYQYSWECVTKKPETTMKLEMGENGEFYLLAYTSKTELQPELANYFDENNRLMMNSSFGGEFYLDQYKSPKDLENERIFRFISGRPVEITHEILRLRENQEQRGEIRSSFRF